MPEVKLQAGATLDTINKSEMREALTEARAIEYERLRGRKLMRFRSPSAAPTGGNLTIGGIQYGQGTILGPAEGYVWSVRLLVIVGLTASATTPDVMNIYTGGTGTLFWQLNGNVFAQTFGRGELLMQPGESLYIQNSGALAATGQIFFHGRAEEAPAERAGDVF